jgi:hypothetical protein
MHWVENKPLCLVAEEWLGSDEQLDDIQKWCQEHNCGRRTSYDQFQFKNKKQITVFLLRWGS